MAGFFGLFDYSKPGKGVGKEVMQKKGFVVFFEVLFRKFWKLIEANLMFILFSIPLVTSGLAYGGLTCITRNFVRQEHAFIWQDFVDTIKKNWKQLLPTSIINFLVTVILLFDIYFFYMQISVSKIWYIPAAICIGLFIIFTFMQYYIPYMIITFRFTFKQLYKNAVIFAFVNLWKNLLLTVILALFWAVIVVVFLTSPIGMMISIALFFFLAFAFTSYLTNFMIYPSIKKYIIDPYYRDHPEEEKPFHLAMADGELDDEDDGVFVDKGRAEDFDE